MDKKYWMKYTVKIASETNISKLKIGAVLVSNTNGKYYDSFSNNYNLNWVDVLLFKIKDIKDEEYDLYVTINSMSNNNEFDLNNILKIIKIKNIYVGVPDPNLTTYLSKDPVIFNNNIYRYPDELQKIIIKQNFKYYENSTQSINNNPYYSTMRITNMLLENLAKNGFILTKTEINNNKTVEKLSQYISKKYKCDYLEIYTIVTKCLSTCFNNKYSSYDYSKDAIGINDSWIFNFLSIYKKIETKPIENLKIIDIGVGSGNEASQLFSTCKNITFVDIAKDGLEKIKKQIPFANIVLARAESLTKLIKEEFDLYISLRTYNSSFFDTGLALREARKILKRNGKIIISISNGFLYLEQNKIIPGLIIPGIDFVDIYRGLDMAKVLAKQLMQINFTDIRYFITNEEIYVVASCS